LPLRARAAGAAPGTGRTEPAATHTAPARCPLPPQGASRPWNRAGLRGLARGATSLPLPLPYPRRPRLTCGAPCLSLPLPYLRHPRLSLASLPYPRHPRLPCGASCFPCPFLILGIPACPAALPVHPCPFLILGIPACPRRSCLIPDIAACPRRPCLILGICACPRCPLFIPDVPDRTGAASGQALPRGIRSVSRSGRGTEGLHPRREGPPQSGALPPGQCLDTTGAA
jgi:hypothetical protein